MSDSYAPFGLRARGARFFATFGGAGGAGGGAGGGGGGTKSRYGGYVSHGF